MLEIDTPPDEEEVDTISPPAISLEEQRKKAEINRDVLVGEFSDACERQITPGYVHEDPGHLLRDLQVHYQYTGDVEVRDSTWLVLVWKEEGCRGWSHAQSFIKDFAFHRGIKSKPKCESRCQKGTDGLDWEFCYEWMVGFATVNAPWR